MDDATHLFSYDILFWTLCYLKVKMVCHWTMARKFIKVELNVEDGLEFTSQVNTHCSESFEMHNK